jgi:DGQHR domain-containing protein
MPQDQDFSLESTDSEVDQDAEVLRYSVSLVTQGKHRFYTLTMPSDVLARTSFATTRHEDPIVGFQRVLDKTRAQQIADYIDSGLGTIPTSIVLSAQPDAKFRVLGKGKTVEFNAVRKAFLIIDGQHRVYGFYLAKTKLRVPVVIYNGLSKTDEARLFIDINTKQRPVSNELLLDIKKLAEYETTSEKLFGEIFDLFADGQTSPLLGLMSPTDRARGKLSRVTFNAAMKPILATFGGVESEQVYGVLSEYMRATLAGLSKLQVSDTITNPTVFRAFVQLFPEAAQRVQDRFAGRFTAANFETVLEPLFSQIKGATLQKPGKSHNELFETLARYLRQHFTLSRGS